MLRRIFFIAIALVLVWFFLFSPSFLLSETQEDTVKALGYPHQFVISYMPTGDEDSPTLTRNEVWYYPEHDLKIIFVAGDVFLTEEYLENMEGVEPTKLKPENFYFAQNVKNVKEHLKSKSYEFESFADDTVDNNTKSYISNDAFFTIENGKMVYFQTLGISYEE